VNKLSVVGLSAATLLFSSAVTIAQEIGRTTLQAGGDKAIRVELYAGTGVTLNFIQVGVVETIFLDNPNLVAIDSDGCLVGIQSTCPKNQASLLHLKLLSGSSIAGIPKSARSALTVVVLSAKGERQLFLFDLRKGTKSAADRIALIDIVSTNGSTDLASRVAAGVKVAKKRGLLTDDLSNRCDLLVGYLRKGHNLPTAARLAGVSELFVSKLAALGTN
jgi:hypothetical protein